MKIKSFINAGIIVIYDWTYENIKPRKINNFLLGKKSIKNPQVGMYCSSPVLFIAFLSKNTDLISIGCDFYGLMVETLSAQDKGR